MSSESLPINFDEFFDHCARTRFKPWIPHFQHVISQALTTERHGDLARWLDALERLPALDIDQVACDLNSSRVTATTRASVEPTVHEHLRDALLLLHPWRKGPYQIADVHIDTEWRSDWKWERVAPHLHDLNKRKILDVGCGSGYHLWRMIGAGASMAVGIDPSLLFLCQFEAIKRYLGAHPAYLLPVGIEAMPSGMKAFDTVFSMGVLYHRKSPLEHLLELRDLTVPKGQLVLETLVVEGQLGYSLVPKGRYARMGNVWFLPSPDTLLHWMEKCGWRNPRVVDLNITGLDEQRATDWMTFHSLKDFLDPNDTAKTLEGYPAPLRAVVVADAP